MGDATVPVEGFAVPNVVHVLTTLAGVIVQSSAYSCKFA